MQDFSLILIVSLMVVVILVLPIILLRMRDKYLQSKGLSQQEIVRIGMVWMVCPVMLIFSFELLLMWWAGAQKLQQTTSFLLTLAITLLSMFSLQYFANTKAKKAKLNRTRVSLWGGLWLLALLLVMKPLTYYLYFTLNQYSLLTSALYGFISALILFTAFAMFLNYYFSKPPTHK